MKFLCFLLLGLPHCLLGQGLRNTSDNRSVFKTKSLALAKSVDAKLSFAFVRTTDGIYLETSGSEWGIGTIDKNDLFVLKLANGDELKIKSIDVQSFKPTLSGGSYTHTYAVAKDDIMALSRNTVVTVRKFLFAESTELSITLTEAQKLKLLSQNFFKEIEKQSKKPDIVFTPKPSAELKRTRIQLKDVEKFMGQNIEFSSTVFITRFYESAEQQATILDFQSSRTGPNARAIIWRGQNGAWNRLPKGFFTGKEVCIAGNLYWYDHTPYIQISDKSQLKVISPLTTDEAKFFVNDSIKIAGVVEEIIYNKDIEQPVTLHLRSPQSTTKLKLLIKRSNFSNAESDEKSLLKKTIIASGKVEQKNNELQMLISQWDNIQMSN